MPLLARRLLAVAATAVVAALALAGCGGGEEHVALAVQKAERPNGTVILHVECAEDIEVEQRPDPAGSGLQQVTVWGDPKVGRCDPTNQAALNDLAEDEFVDGATSQVVHVERSCLPKPQTCTGG
jgi:hypothetical protein